MFGTNIFWTFLSKFGSAIASLAILIISSRELGAERMGIISLVILGITIVQLPAGLFGGTALVYMVPRHSFITLFVPAYFFAVVASGIVTYVLAAAEAFPRMYFREVFCLGVLVSWYTINLYILLGKERIRWHNFITLLQSVVQLGVLYVLILRVGNQVISSYLYAYEISYALAWLLSFISLPFSLKGAGFTDWKAAIRDTFRYGFMVQVSSFLQLGNYRLTYYFIKKSLGLQALGIFSVAIQVAESVWIISRSISMVQFARVSNSDNPHDHVRRTLFLVKLSVLGTFAGLIVFFLVPARFFLYIFGHDFGAVKELILYLSPGIFAVAVTSILSAYFSGSGNIRINTLSSFIGLLIVAVAGHWLIMYGGLPGAAAANVAAYLGAFVFSVVMFVRKGNVSFRSFLPGSSDRELVRLFFSRFFSRQK